LEAALDRPARPVAGDPPRGRLLLLLCAVQFLDVVDSSIMNVALTSIRRDLGFSAQGLQWVLSGYLALILFGAYRVVILARREERLKEAAAELTARYDVHARVVAVDLGRDGILDRVTEATGDLNTGKEIR